MLEITFPPDLTAILKPTAANIKRFKIECPLQNRGASAKRTKMTVAGFLLFESF